MTTWHPGPLKRWLALNDSGVWGDDPTGGDDTLVVRSTEINLDGSWDLSDVAERSLPPFDRITKRLLEGDLVVVKSSGSAAHLGKTAIVDRSTAALGPCFANFVQRLRPTPDGDSRYIWYLLNSRIAAAEMEMLGNTSTGLRNLNGGVIGSVTCPGPPIAEQRVIADYLDAETARIDALIERKRRMVELAAERVRSFISQATDEPPYTQLRHLTSLRTSGPRGWADRVSESGRPFVRSANLRKDSTEIRLENLVLVDAPKTEEARRSVVREGDVLIAITGANVGWVGCAGTELVGGFVSQHVAILRPADVTPEWLAYSLFASRAQDQLLGGQYGGTKQQLGLDELAELRIANPSSDEQRRRIEAMTQARLAGERLASRLEDQIALLIEHRQALITAAVTGEIEVSGVAA